VCLAAIGETNQLFNSHNKFIQDMVNFVQIRAVKKSDKASDVCYADRTKAEPISAGT